MEQNEEEDYVDLTSPDNVYAINSVKPDFMRKWDGNQLFEYYKNRTLIYEQVKAIVAHDRNVGEVYKSNHPEEDKEFLEGGEFQGQLSLKDIFNCALKAFPYTSMLCYDDLLKRLNKTGSCD